MIRYASLDFTAPLPAPVFGVLLQSLPLPLQREVTRYHRWQDQHASLLGKLLVRRLLAGFGYPCALHELYRDAFGKPWLPGTLDFSISHSGTVVACAMSDTYRVGLDVEQIQLYELDDFQALLRPDEVQALRQAGMAQPFCQLWTQKEGLVKAKGVGLVSGLRLQDIYVEADGCRYQGPEPPERWYYYPVPVPAAYVATLCTQVPGLRIEHLPLDLAGLCQAEKPGLLVAAASPAPVAA